jgi:hypothetical protein
VKVAAVAPLEIVTAGGSDKPVLETVNTTVKDDGLEVLTVTEQLPEPPAATLAGVQISDDSERSDNEIEND